MLQQLIQSMVSLIDNFMVSGLGDISMSGANVVGQVLFVFIVFNNTICMSGGIFLTQFYGACKKSGMQQALFATVIARTLEFIIFAAIYLRTKPDFAVLLGEYFRIDGMLFREILKKVHLCFSVIWHG